MQYQPHYDNLVRIFRSESILSDPCHRAVARFKEPVGRTCTHTELAPASSRSSSSTSSRVDTIADVSASAPPPRDASKRRKMDAGGEDKVPPFRNTCQQISAARSVTHPPAKTIRILYVPDKRYMEPLAKIRKALPTNWITTTIPQDRWEELSSNPGAEGYVYPTEVGKFPVRSNTLTVHIEEWVSVRLFKGVRLFSQLNSSSSTLLQSPFTFLDCSVASTSCHGIK